MYVGHIFNKCAFLNEKLLFTALRCLTKTLK